MLFLIPSREVPRKLGFECFLPIPRSVTIPPFENTDILSDILSVTEYYTTYEVNKKYNKLLCALWNRLVHSVSKAYALTSSTV